MNYMLLQNELLQIQSPETTDIDLIGPTFCGPSMKWSGFAGGSGLRAICNKMEIQVLGWSWKISSQFIQPAVGRRPRFFTVAELLLSSPGGLHTGVGCPPLAGTLPLNLTES